MWFSRKDSITHSTASHTQRLFPLLFGLVVSGIAYAALGLMQYATVPRVIIQAGTPASLWSMYYDDGTGMQETKRILLPFDDTQDVQTRICYPPVRQLKSIMLKPMVAGRIRIKEIRFERGLRRVILSGRSLFEAVWFTDCSQWNLEGGQAVIDVTPKSYFLLHRDLAARLAFPSLSIALLLGVAAALLSHKIANAIRFFIHWTAKWSPTAEKRPRAALGRGLRRGAWLPLAAGLAAATMVYIICWLYLPYPPTTVIIRASFRQPSAPALLYDDGSGMSELKRVTLPLQNTTASQTLRWTLPSSKIISIMIRPLAANSVAIDYVRFDHNGQSLLLTGHELFQAFWFVDCDQWALENSAARIETRPESYFLMHRKVSSFIKFKKRFPLLPWLLAGLAGLGVGACLGRLQGFIITLFRPLRRPRMVFLAVALPFGLAYLFLTPPFQAPDEAHHFYRSFAVSEGRLTSSLRQGYLAGDWLPRSLKTLARECLQRIHYKTAKRIDRQRLAGAKTLALSPSQRGFFSLGSILMYSPVNYLPQALGMALARMLSIRPFYYIYWGRISIFLVWLMLTYLAIKVAPAFKRVILLVALVPTSLFIATSLSADTLVNASAFLFLALLVRSKLQAPASGLNPVLLLGTAVLLTMSKLVYFPLLLLVFLMPADRWPARKQYWIFMAAFFLTNLVFNAAWHAVIRDIMPYVQINPPELFLQKKRYVLEHPWKMLHLVWSNFSGHGIDYLRTALLSLGWNDVPLHNNLLWFYSAALVFTALRDSHPRLRFSLADKILVIAVAALLVVLVLTTLFTVAAPWSVSTLRVHGRYFLPVLAPLLLVFYGRARRNRHRFYGNALLFLFLCLVHLYCLKQLVLRYYGG